MHLRSLVIGLVLGAGLTAGAFLWLGDSLKEDVADATERAGEQVERVGEKIGEAAREIR
jgi:hypothetical protein